MTRGAVAPLPTRRLLPASTEPALYWRRMDVEQTIADIERLERWFAAPDQRPLSASDISAANRRHDATLARSPWFRLWQEYGLCCRPAPPVLRLPES